MADDCLSCTHAKPLVGPDQRIDFTRRVCQESPPVPILVGMDINRQPLVQPYFPIVGAGVRCDRHDARLVGEVVDTTTKTQ